MYHHRRYEQDLLLAIPAACPALSLFLCLLGVIIAHY